MPVVEVYICKWVVSGAGARQQNVSKDLRDTSTPAKGVRQSRRNKCRRDPCKCFRSIKITRPTVK